jgi:hypothetical protein
VGGLVGMMGGGTIIDSYATGSVRGGKDNRVGGLVGLDVGGMIESSFATSVVSDEGGYAGGLVAVGEYGSAKNCYATGTVTMRDGGDLRAYAGGFAGIAYYGETDGFVINSYATGAVKGTAVAGGFAGESGTPSGASDDYWDITTSGTDVGVRVGDSGGITGLTTAQLQSGLPAGFDSTIWVQNPKINHGFPYLIANPPPK